MNKLHEATIRPLTAHLYETIYLCYFDKIYQRYQRIQVRPRRGHFFSLRLFFIKLLSGQIVTKIPIKRLPWQGCRRYLQDNSKTKNFANK